MSTADSWTAKSLHAEGPRYLAIVERIQRDIAAGALKAGTRLPPQRSLAARLGVDLTTVSRAYAEARRRGLVAGHVGRGTYVRAGAERSVAADGREGDATVDLSLNLPPAIVVEEAERALAATLEELPRSPAFAGLLNYQPNAGRLDHREAGTSWIARRGLDCPASQVIVASGAQHALTVLLTSLCPAGATVMTEALTYPVFKLLADQLRLTTVALAMDAEGLMPESFRGACEAGARVLYCTPTLQNPTTAIMSAARRRQVASIAAEFGVTIIEDDVYGMLPREAPPALSTFAPDRTYFVASLSKSVAPGLRIAYIAAPTDRAARQTAAGVRATTWMAAPLTAEIAAIWIRTGIATQLLAAYRDESNTRQATASRMLGAHDWRAHPESFHGWLTLPPSWSTAEFVMQARRAGIAVTPGDAFAVAGPINDAAVRLSIGAAPSLRALEIALDRMNRLLETGPDAASSLL